MRHSKSLRLSLSLGHLVSPSVSQSGSRLVNQWAMIYVQQSLSRTQVRASFAKSGPKKLSTKVKQTWRRRSRKRRRGRAAKQMFLLLFFFRKVGQVNWVKMPPCGTRQSRSALWRAAAVSSGAGEGVEELSRPQFSCHESES